MVTKFSYSKEDFNLSYYPIQGKLVDYQNARKIDRFS